MDRFKYMVVVRHVQACLSLSFRKPLRLFGGFSGIENNPDIFFLPLNGFHSICWGIKKSVMKTQQTLDQNSYARVVWRQWNFIFQSKVHWHFTILWCEKTSIKPLHFTILIAFIYIVDCSQQCSLIWYYPGFL